MTTATAEDIAEMRRDGSFQEFLRHQLAAGRRIPVAVQAPAAAVSEPGHRPGAWPTGTRPPAAVTAGTTEEWQQAVHDYRAWNAAGCPPGDFTCECGCNPGIRPHTRREAS
jgi:hypothetical protein